MNFNGLRNRSYELVERALTEMEERNTIEYNQIQSIEKIVKILDILEEANDRVGNASPFADSTTEDLSSEFDE